jgi:hypothetical protein
MNTINLLEGEFMAVDNTKGMERQGNSCAQCELFTAASQTHGICEFWKSMDVRPIWMEGEHIPTHTVKREDGENCEAFVPQNDNSNARQNWLLDNLTSMN